MKYNEMLIRIKYIIEEIDSGLSGCKSCECGCEGKIHTINYGSFKSIRYNETRRRLNALKQAYRTLYICFKDLS